MKATKKLATEMLSSHCLLCDYPFLPCELEEICPSKDGKHFAHLRCVDELTLYAGSGRWASATTDYGGQTNEVT